MISFVVFSRLLVLHILHTLIHTLTSAEVEGGGSLQVAGGWFLPAMRAT